MKRFEVAGRLCISNSAARQLFVYTKNCNRKCYVICMGGCQIRLRLQLHVVRVYVEIGKT